MIREFKSLYELPQVFGDEQACIDHLRSIRWKNGPFCPYCGSIKVYDFSDKRTHKCGDCRQRFSIKVGSMIDPEGVDQAGSLQRGESRVFVQV